MTLRTAAGAKRKLAGSDLSATKGGATRTLTFSIPVAKGVPAGDYRLVACVRKKQPARTPAARRRGR